MDLIKKNNNRGFSLVEVVVAFGILMVVTTIVFGLMVSSSNSFSRASADVDVQSEAQLASNSIKELLIDCQRSVAFFDSANKLVDGTNEYENALLISNYDEQYLIYPDPDPGSDTLLFMTRTRNAVTSNFTDNHFEDPEILAKYVKDFEVDLGTLSSDNTVRFAFTYELRGKEYKGSYQVFLRNKDVVVDTQQDYENINNPKVQSVTVAPSPAYLVPSMDPTLIAEPLQFNALVRVSGPLDPGKTWSVEGAPDCFSIDTNGKLTTLSVPDNAEYRVIATPTADTSMPGAAKLLVKKVNSVTIRAMSGTTGGSAGEVQSAARNSRVLFAASVDGYNLMSSDKGVTWALEYRPNSTTPYSLISYYDSSAGGYRDLRPDVGQINANGMMTIGENVTNNYSFRITAQAQFPNYKSAPGTTVSYMADSCELAIRNQDINFNGAFVRGLNIDLKSYYMSGKAAADLAIDSDVTEVRAYTTLKDSSGNALSPDLNQLRNNSILYMDIDTFQYSSQAQYQQYYDAQDVYVQFLNQDNETRSMKISLPKVSVTKALPVENYLVIRKGATKDIMFSYTGMNVTDSSQIGIYIDDQKVNSSGVSTINPHISAYVKATGSDGKSAFGTKDRYVSSQTVRIAASSTATGYPISVIPFKITLEDFYQATGGAGTAESYFECPVYIANVEGQELYIPGPSATNFPTTSITESEKSFTLGPASTSVKLKKSGSKYYMVYSNTTYVYNEANKYWKKQ